MNTKTTTIIIGILMIVALVGGVILVNQNQDTRRGAAFSTSTLILLPNSTITKTVGENFQVHVNYVGATGIVTKIDGVQTVVCYDNSKINLVDGETVGNNAAGFETVPIIAYNDVSGKKCATVVVNSKQNATVLRGTADAITLTYKAMAAGSGDIEMGRSLMTGDNPNNALDKWVTINNTGAVVKANYVINPENTTMPLLKFRMAFYGIGASDACAEPGRMPLTVTVRYNDDTNEVHTNVIPVKAGGTNALAYYDASFRLNTAKTGNFSVFVKGPKHLQMKYGRDNQRVNYEKAGGELLTTDLTNIADTTKMYHFEGLPLLTGDVVSETDETQNGVIDGRDFSFVKTKSTDRKEVPVGGYMLADLNGNCQMESQDVVILMKSLEEKQEQLY